MVLFVLWNTNYHAHIIWYHYLTGMLTRQLLLMPSYLAFFLTGIKEEFGGYQMSQ